MGIPALNSTLGGHTGFEETQWGLLLSGGLAPEGEEARTAWEHLYRIYCHPVYAFIRRKGFARAQAQDLTQDFFLHLLEKGTLGRADPAKGRFRTFLLGALDYFLADAARREGARKRGGGSQFIFLDASDAAENEYQLAAPLWESPERIFDARWAATLVEAAFARLRAEMVAAGREAYFEALRDYVAGSEDATYQETAERLGLPLPRLKGIIHRLRTRFGLLLREEVGRTVAGAGDVDGEVRHLLAALRGRA